MTSMHDLQEQLYPTGHDYADGSPHIRHHAVRSMVVNRLQGEVHRILDATGRCRVLEVGAGHGTFTDHLVAAGASVEVTEMSAPSAEELRRRFRHVPSVSVVEDPDGELVARGDQVDLVTYVSVLHHIPDYLAAVRDVTARIAPGGAFVSFQDPLWYARRTRLSRTLDQAAYLAWRVPRGDLTRGVTATLRRARGTYDSSQASDMVEYHYVRDGVDEQALVTTLRRTFADIELIRYWTAQSSWAQAAGGGRLTGPNTFGVVARGAGSA